MINKGTRPSILTPFVRVAAGLGGAASAFLGNDRALNVSLALQKVIEDTYDESLRIVNESDDKQVRQVDSRLIRL